jgi:hypothetical protein
MTAFAHDAARAALPVAIGLLALAVTAAGALWAPVDDARALRLARRYLEPLSTWCLIALATHLLALGAAGELDVLSLALPLVLGAAAGILRSADGADGQAGPDPEAVAPPPAPPAAAPERPAPAPAAPAPPPASGGSLWAGHDDERAPRTGLWSRG